MPDNNSPEPTYSFGQQPIQGNGNLPNIYPPPSADEVRLTRQLDRIEHKLDAIFAKLHTLKITDALPETKKTL